MFSFSLLASSLSFVKRCQLIKEEKNPAFLKTKKTFEVLFRVFNTKDCRVLEGKLLQTSFISLREEDIEDLTPLAYFVNIKSLDLSGNKISSLWGVDKLVNIRELYLKDNNIEDLTPLSFVEGLRLVDLSGNNISNLIALKAHMNLDIVIYEDNPICLDEDSCALFNGLQIFRSFQSRGLDYEIPISDFQYIALLDEVCEREDLNFFKYNDLTLPVVGVGVTDSNVLLNLNKKTQKVIAAWARSDLVAKNLVNYYREKLAEKFQHTVDEAFFSELRKNCHRVLLFFFAAGGFPPTCNVEIQAVENYLLIQIKKDFVLNPTWLYKKLNKWQEEMLASGIPPALKSGFLSL